MDNEFHERILTQLKNGKDHTIDDEFKTIIERQAEQHRRMSVGTHFGFGAPPIPAAIQPTTSREQDLEAMVDKLVAENYDLKKQLRNLTTTASVYQNPPPASTTGCFPLPSQTKGVLCQIFHNTDLTASDHKKHRTDWVLKFEAHGSNRSEAWIGLYYPKRFYDRCKQAMKTMTPAARELLDVAIEHGDTTLFGVTKIYKPGGGTKWLNQAAIVCDFASDQPEVVVRFSGEEIQFSGFRPGTESKKACKWHALWTPSTSELDDVHLTKVVHS